MAKRPTIRFSAIMDGISYEIASVRLQRSGDLQINPTSTTAGLYRKGDSAPRKISEQHITVHCSPNSADGGKHISFTTVLDGKDKVGDAAKIDGSRTFVSPVFAVLVGDKTTKRLNARSKDTVLRLTTVPGPYMLCAYMLVGVIGTVFPRYPNEYGVTCCEVGEFVVAVYHHICGCPMVGDNVTGFSVTAPQQINGVDTSNRSSDKVGPLTPSEYHEMLDKFRSQIIGEMDRLLRQRAPAEADRLFYQLQLCGVAD